MLHIDPRTFPFSSEDAFRAMRQVFPEDVAGPLANAFFVTDAEVSDVLFTVDTILLFVLLSDEHAEVVRRVWPDLSPDIDGVLANPKMLLDKFRS